MSFTPAGHVSAEWRPPRQADPLIPPSVSLDLDTPTFKQLNARLTEWRTRAAFVRAIDEQIGQRKAEVGELEADYRAEVERHAESGKISGGREEALLARIRAFGPELRDIWAPKRAAAIDLAAAAAAEYDSFLRGHWRELLSELEPAATEVHESYHAELARCREKLVPLEDRRDRIAEAARHFTRGVRPFVAADVSDNPGDVPLPSEESWRRYNASLTGA